MKKKQRETFHFFIDHLDPLGQGVHKEDEVVTFIPKTLPGEEGLAMIKSRSKGVAFAQLLEIHKKSPQRSDPACPHFDKCGSCHYLHTDYKSELGFKQQAMQRLTKTINHNDLPIKVHPAPRRFAYRERIQLHYDQNQLGYHLPRSHQILPVPSCLLPEEAIQDKIRSLYQDSTWRKLEQQIKGHLEIRRQGKETKISWNRPYAEDGFTQVFGEMNLVLKAQVADIARASFPNADLIVDLFGGNGNLSQDLKANQKLIVDIGPRPLQLPPESRFLSLDLFDEKQTFEALRGLNPDILILDPPRSGIKTLSKIVEKLKPKLIIYISCHCATMVRDLKNLSSEYAITSLELFDLFPTTHHFESLAALKLL